MTQRRSFRVITVILSPLKKDNQVHVLVQHKCVIYILQGSGDIAQERAEGMLRGGGWERVRGDSVSALRASESLLPNSGQCYSVHSRHQSKRSLTHSEAEAACPWQCTRATNSTDMQNSAAMETLFLPPRFHRIL